ncbi:helix-turn-helix domain-containing protein [Gymnodinialimonas hymeniacidonis]|uniref:TetR/AcrR family transcriptional regulator n=1 Tax=Gymnodinialimonas hymeniacidonis TaxID=3126508 RepID=UPI0034C5F663
MQEKNVRRPNSVRSEEMKARLMAAARALFVEKGFAETGTPEIVKRAEVTRGALYHHFADKAALFDAVVLAEAEALRADIKDGATGLEDGSRAFFAAMRVPGRARLLLVDGPAVLGHARMDEIDAGGGRHSLAEGLEAALPKVSAAERTALAVVLSAAFDRAALAIADGADEEDYIAAMLRVMRVVAS